MTRERVSGIRGAPALALLIATAAVARVVLGYAPFPTVDDFTYVPMGLAALDPELFPRDDILRGYVNHVPLWPALIFAFERTLGLVEGLFLLTLLLTLVTIYFLRRLLRSLGATDFALPLVIALAVTVSVQGVGRGAYDGLLGSSFHMQWIALTLLLGAYDGFVRGRATRAGAFLGAAAWMHPLVAFHGALCILVAGLIDRTRGIVEVAKTGLGAVVVSLPVSVLVLADILTRPQPVADTGGAPLADILLFRAPHHYDLAAFPFLVPALLGVLALAARRPLIRRDRGSTRRFYGILAGHALLLGAAFVLHGPLFFGEQPPGPFLVYALDLTRTSPLFIALAATAVAAAVPPPREVGAPDPGSVADRALKYSTILAVSFLLLLNLRHSPWIYVLLLLSAAAWVARRRSRPLRAPTAALFALSAVAGVAFFADADLRARTVPPEAALYSWARSETPRDALFVVPPGMQAFRLEGRRSVYVDFKSFPPSQPSLIREWRRRLEEVTNPDARALERGRGWPGVAWWDAAYAQRNPPERIADLLARTGADFFVLDLLLAEAPPHLPSGNPHDDPGKWVGLVDVAWENSRYRVYRRPPAP